MNTTKHSVLAAVLFASMCAAETVPLTELDLSHLHFEGWRKPQVDKSFSGKPLSIAGQKFERGIGTRALSTLWLELDGRTEKFSASVGVDDAAGNADAAVVFTIFGDGRKLWGSGVMKRSQPAKTVDVGLRGVRSLLLKVDHAGENNNFDHADWIEPRFIVTGAKPRTINAPREKAVILTPPPPRAPRINGPKVYGCRPGNPFIYRIPTTGDRPMEFAADGLPASLRLNTVNGIITGAAPARGPHIVTLRAKNKHGATSREFKIVSGDTLALTPPMGWNHWYAHYNRVTDAMMRDASDVMISSGMADVGYSYVNIDDCWMNAAPDAKRRLDRDGPFRDAAGNIFPNRHFPDMRALTDYIHAKGLKAGIYTSPGPLTCGGFCGAYQHEEQDARQFADWGFDFLKYDWCSYSKIAAGDKSIEMMKKPYVLMGGILKRLPRDIVFNLCQYGMGDVWEWGAEIGGHCWRTAGDLGAELNRIFPVALKNAEHRQWSKPGSWNDPDYVQIGFVGDARGEGAPKPCPLTPTEQYSFMSLWCLSAAPLFYSGDMSQLDAFTVNVLCNPEVIEVDQDPLGECAQVVKLTSDTFLMVKRMEDGSKAVGLCNGGEIPASFVAKWSDLGVTGKQIVRDLWRQRDLGKFDAEFKATVPRHGVVLLRLRPVSATSVISLAGEWRFQLEHGASGKINLPGTLPEHGIGDDVTLDTKWTGGIVDKSFFDAPEYEKYRKPGNFKVPFWLQPDKYYVGVASYQRDIEIPSSWQGKRVVLSLERPHWETRIWVDDKPFGSNNSLATPHDYDLGLLKPGKHTLTIRVDNRMVIDVGENSHSVSDHTQGNWNGIVGKIELRATPPVWIEDVQVYPNVAKHSVRVRVKKGGQASATLHVGTKSVEITDVAEVEVPVDAKTWDEFTPNLQELTVRVSDDQRIVRFGLCEFAAQGTQFTINGRKTFIRGTLDCCIYPKTGHPPTDVAEWKRIIGVAKAHGLNLIRFHSWCPPEAAFVAADELGFYFHVEASSWANQSTTIGDGKPVDQWVYEETDRILKYYGNHPSFILMPYGNEPGGKNHKEYLAKWVVHYKAKDPRRLWCAGAGWPELPENQWHCVPAPRIQSWGGGLKSRINAKPPETTTDYHDYISKRNVPVVSHEIGQWCVYPNFDEIKKYTGYLKPKNFDIFRDRLAEHHMLDQARDFLLASGKLQTLCYKEDIESALRTPGMAGFELLDLHDFPGQGTALVGVLDPFWEEKGYVTAKEYRRFCNSTVPLARLAKRVFTTDEKLEASIEVAHYGPGTLGTVAWRLVGDNGKVVGSGRGNVSVELKSVPAPARYKLVATVDRFENDWDLWIYPPQADTQPPVDVKIVEEIDANTSGKVLLLIPPLRVKNATTNKVVMGFSSIFWNTAWTRRQPPTTLGILCNPKHPALADFPTDFHSNWQWWYLITRAAPMILDDLPASLRPTVQVIDDWFTAHKLGLVFEANVGNAKVVVCSIALDDSNPVARQFRHSLLRYMASDKFAPKQTLELGAVQKLFGPLGVVRSVRASSEASHYEAGNAIDGDPNTMWHSSWTEPAPKFPHELIIELAKPTKITGIICLPGQDRNPNGRIKYYAVQVSDDSKTWREAARGAFTREKTLTTVMFDKPVEARWVKLIALSSIDPSKPFAAVAELTVIADRRE